MKRKLKSLIKAVLYYLVNSLVWQSRLITPNTLLLVRTDTIGDYVLFRNFIEIIKKNKKYKNHRITLFGNIAWKELAIEFDDQFIDEFIWIDIRKFEKNLPYRFKKLSLVSSRGYEVLINPIFSRDFYTSDTVAKLVSANKKVAHIGDLSNLSISQKQISDRFYTDLVPVNNISMFEFYRNKDFFEYFLGETLVINKPTIRPAFRTLNIELPDNFTVLFVGASSTVRRWSASNFAKVAEHLKQACGQEIVLCGGPSDRGTAHEFSRYFPDDHLDLVGKTSMTELLSIIDHATLLISNETVAPHLAVALGGVQSIVISNGNHYGRFTPYPLAITDLYYGIYHPDTTINPNTYANSSNSYGGRSYLNINDIDVKEVISKIKNI